MKKRNAICNYVEIIMSITSFIAFLFCYFNAMFFNAFQFLMMSICIIIPFLIKTLLKIKLSIIIDIIYQLFILAHFLFGEVLSFYIIILNYDTALHLLSAIFICFVAFDVLKICNYNLKILFSVLIALTCEYIWEIIEFSIDHFFKTNMQRFVKNGVELIGHYAIMDTMKDMIVAILGCLIFMLISLKKKKSLKGDLM